MSNKIPILDHENRDAVKWIDAAPDTEPGPCPENRIAVVRADGTRIGHVGHGAGASVAERLLGGSRRGVELGTHKGKRAWVEKSVAPQARRASVSALTSAVDHAANIASAKGSVGKPHKPVVHARPRRG
jgi:hypothetical protein